MDFLSVSWRPALGEVDGYLVTLRDREKTVSGEDAAQDQPVVRVQIAGFRASLRRLHLLPKRRL